MTVLPLSARSMATIMPLSAIDPELIEQLLDRAFGDDRHARTAYRIREGTRWLEPLSFAALDDGEFLAGTIQLWPIALTTPDGKPHPMLMVGPVAVLPQRQGEGFGKALMAAALGALDPRAALPQVLIGDEAYYGAWGFAAAPAQGWYCPGPFEQKRLLVRCDTPSILPDDGMLGPWLG